MKTNKNTLLIVIIIVMAFQFKAIGQEAEKIIIGTTHKIQSKVLNEARTYIVGLPESYNENLQTYPILVLLDGGFRFHSHSGIINHMVRGRQVPEMIIVAITNVDRVRDYTPTNYLTNLNGSSAIENHKTSGKSKAFLKFIEEELLAEIDKNYRTNSFKTFVGISHGGLLVGSSYVSNNSSFDAFISMDPSFWWDNQHVVNQIDNLDTEKVKGRKFYLSTADKYENFKRIPHVFKANINSHELFNAKLKNKGVEPSNLKFEYFEEENHWTVALVSLYNGLQFVFKDYYMEDFYSKSAEEIIDYYKNIYNGKLLPPENNINRLGYNYMRQREGIEEALKLFQINVNNYPKSYNAYDSLGEVYKIIGDKNKAIKNYNISLILNPNNENAKQMIKQLEKE